MKGMKHGAIWKQGTAGRRDRRHKAQKGEGMVGVIREEKRGQGDRRSGSRKRVAGSEAGELDRVRSGRES